MRKVDSRSEEAIKDKKKDFESYILTRSEYYKESFYSCFFNKDDRYYEVSGIYLGVPLINLMGYEVGVEVGVSHGHSTITMLDLCKSIKKLYCIDSYKPYKDYYSEDYYVDQYEINIVKNLALKKITNADEENKITFYEEDSDVSVERFGDDEVDFVFLDAHLDSEHIKKDLRKWYPKVRSGGMLIIHDTVYPTVKEEIDEFVKYVNFSGKRCDVQSLCALLKE